MSRDWNLQLFHLFECTTANRQYGRHDCATTLIRATALRGVYFFSPFLFCLPFTDVGWKSSSIINNLNALLRSKKSGWQPAAMTKGKIDTARNLTFLTTLTLLAQHTLLSTYVRNLSVLSYLHSIYLKTRFARRCVFLRFLVQIRLGNRDSSQIRQDSTITDKMLFFFPSFSSLFYFFFVYSVKSANVAKDDEDP